MSMYKIAENGGWWNSYLSAMRGDAPEKIDQAAAERKALVDAYGGNEKRVDDMLSGRSKYDRTAEDWRNERAQLARDVRNSWRGEKFYDLKGKELQNRKLDAVSAESYPEAFNDPKAVAERQARDRELRGKLDEAKGMLRKGFASADAELERRMLAAREGADIEREGFQKMRDLVRPEIEKVISDNEQAIRQARMRTLKARGGTALAAAGLLWGGKKLYDGYKG